MSKLSDAAKETVQDARDAIKESGKAASAASGDLRADLQALRDDVTRLAQQIADIFWDTKGVKTRRQPSNQGAVGGELVYPVAG